jgi:AbrB family looped-hinge helix DNA binding protein
MTTATLTSKHQITLPKEVRDRLVLGKGDRVQFVAERDGAFRIAKLPQGVRSDGAARRRLKAAGGSWTSAAIRRLAGEGARASVARRSGP